MPTLRLLSTRWAPRVALSAPRHCYQSLNKPDSTKTKKRYQQQEQSLKSSSVSKQLQSSDQPSLFEELFPEEAAKEKASHQAQESKPSPNLPRLLPLKLEESPPKSLTSSKTIKPEKPNPYTLDSIAVIVAGGLSTSLTGSDFRRIAPKGRHIKDWTGPGDIVKIFPGRDAATLTQLPYYFLIFKNIANALLYRRHVLRIHQAAQQYSLDSFQSPAPPQPRHGGGASVTDNEGGGVEQEQEPEPEAENGGSSAEKEVRRERHEDVLPLLKDYALCPLSQDPQLKLFRAPITGRIKKIVENGGYPAITRGGTDGEDRTGRAVLFWVDTSSAPSTEELRAALMADGRERGSWWNCGVETLEVAVKDAGRVEKDAKDEDIEADQPQEELSGRLEEKIYSKGRVEKWVLTFGEAEDARRFVRRWHRRLFPVEKEMDEARARAEILW